MFYLKFLSSRYKARVKHSMRGFNILEKEGKLDLITVIKNDLSIIDLNCKSINSSSKVFGAGKVHCELILRQFLFVKVLDLEFNKELLIALNRPQKEIKHPLPPEWRVVLARYGFKSETILNKFLWQFFLIKYFLFGLITIFFNFQKSLLNLYSSSLNINYTYFQDLSLNNFPIITYKGLPSYDILSWYYKWNGKLSNINRLCHSVKNVKNESIAEFSISYMPSAIPPLKGLIKFVNFIYWGILAVVISFIDLFRGRYWHPLLLRESAYGGQIRLVKPENLATEYLFHNSNHIYRPLWTYDAEHMGSRILFYFYSTNIETFKSSCGYRLQENTWNLLSWSNYLVWDSYQANFIKRWISKYQNIYIVGSIWFSSSAKDFPELSNKKFFAVFDVQPVRDSFFQILGQSTGFYIPEVANLFIKDISEVVFHFGHNILFKRKRNIDRILHKKYWKVIFELTKLDSFLSLDPDIPAYRVIEQSEVVISMPFTSTALIGRELGKPSIFYDPVGIVQLDDRASHGIPIIVGRENLKKWVESVLISKKTRTFLE